MRPIFLTGYMACGKTTLGRALARRLGMEFIDLDFYISQRFRMSVNEIFSRRGEAEFRRMEREMLREAGEFEDVVIACGGGTPCHYDNMDYMLGRGITVWLKASASRIVERVLDSPGKRPLLAGKSRQELERHVAGHLEMRRPYYERAAIRIGSDRLETRGQIADTVEETVRQILLTQSDSDAGGKTR